MHLNKLFIVGVLSLCSLPALAFHCPMDMKKIDSALAAKPQLTKAQYDEVVKLRQLGEQYHKAGDHQRSVETLGRAMQILNIQ